MALLFKCAVGLLCTLLAAGTVMSATFSTCNTGSSTLQMNTLPDSLPAECKAPADNPFQQGLFECLQNIEVTVANCSLTAVPTNVFNAKINQTCSQILELAGMITGESISYNLSFSVFGQKQVYPDKGALEIEPSMYRYGSNIYLDWNGICRYEYKVLTGASLLKAAYPTCDLSPTTYTLQNASSISQDCKGRTDNSVHQGIFLCLKTVKISTSSCLATVTNGVDYVMVGDKKFNCSAISVKGPLTGEKLAERMRWSVDSSVLRGNVFVDQDIVEPYILKPTPWTYLWPNLTLTSNPSTAKLQITPGCVYEYKEGAPSNAAGASFGSRILLAVLGAASLLTLLF